MATLYSVDEDEEGIGEAVFGIPTIPATDWNRLVETLRRNRPLSLSVLEGGGFRHPWNLVPGWNGGENRWECTVQPGYVNGQETGALVAREEAPEPTLERLGVETSGEASVMAWLSERPVIPLDVGMRPIGTDDAGGNSEPVPEFFRALGVGDPPRIDIDLAALEITEVVEDRSALRLLRALDVVLIQPRPRIVADWFTFGLGFAFAQFVVSVVEPPDYEATLAFRARHVPPIPPDPLGRLTGRAEDTGQDELPVATFYLLSPPGVADGTPVDGSWTPYVRHHEFWNLRHDTNDFKPPGFAGDITWPLGLAGGVADLSIIDLAADLNDRTNAARQFIQSESVEGRFWSA